MEEIQTMKPEAGENMENMKSKGRKNCAPKVSFFRAHIKHSDPRLVRKIGVLPPGAFIKSIQVYILKQFDLTNFVFGKTINGDEYGKITLYSPTMDNIWLPLETQAVPQNAEQAIYMTQEKKSRTGEALVFVEFYTKH